MGRGDSGRQRAGCHERVRAVAPEDIRLPPERIGDDAHIGTWCRLRVERVIVIAGHTWHHEGAVGTQCAAQRFNQAPRSTFYRPDLRESGMDQQDAAGFHAQTEELLGHRVYADRIHVIIRA